MLLNIFGVKKVGRVQVVIVALSLLTVVIILFFTVPIINYDLSPPIFKSGKFGFIGTVAFVIVAYAGVTKIAAIAGEIKNPTKNIPLAMFISLLVVSTIYILVSYDNN